MKIELRFRKMRRGIDSARTSFVLKHTPERPFMCPLSQFLGLALADKAFVTLECAEDFSKVRIPPGRSSLVMAIKPECMDLPVLRQPTPGGTTSPEKILTVNCLRDQLKNLGQRAGFRQDLSAYAIRRAHGNTLDNALTTAERQMRMSHAQSHTYSDAYISQISAVDSQALVFGTTQEKRSYDLIRSMMFEHDENAPIPLGVSLDKVHSLSREDRGTTKVNKVNRYKEIRTAYETVIRAGGDTETTLASCRHDSATIFATVLKYDTVRKDVKELIGKESSTMKDVVEIYFAAARQQTFSAVYPRTVWPEDGRCHDCKRKLPADGINARRHLLGCALRRGLKLKAPHITNIRHSFDTWSAVSCKWRDCDYDVDPKKSSWDAMRHLSAHLINDSSRALLKQVQRPFCYACAEVFDDYKDWIDHCEGGFDNSPSGMTCSNAFWRTIYYRLPPPRREGC
ncbi:hypothetical protein KVT40_008379 [Elsinoe batatas]|uniref:C2H2-type domain-containing protein n=1 Tax=Elsinoe batatas TaxID=2601811 RepID=A0A8K0KVJ2_9PEZI|nr:hypothetical protein KVT40_008379 [Elsinoe batatas]